MNFFPHTDRISSLYWEHIICHQSCIQRKWNEGVRLNSQVHLYFYKSIKAKIIAFCFSGIFTLKYNADLFNMLVLTLSPDSLSLRLFAGVVPRMLWITVGGAIFLGVYDKAKVVLSSVLIDTS